MNNPIIGFSGTIGLLIARRVKYFPEDIGREITMEDGKKFTVFRHVKILDKRGEYINAKAVFKIRFTPKNMSAEKNIKFSRIPMMVFMGFRGFCSKYWMVDYTTGECQGLYEWRTYEDAVNYSKSIALRFMTKRSYEGSVSFEIIKQENEEYFIFKELV